MISFPKHTRYQKKIKFKLLLVVTVISVVERGRTTSIGGRQVAEFCTRKVTVRKRCGLTVVKFSTKI